MSIIGKPNVGKSTLLNQLLGQKLCITTPKAQTTRHRILGIDSGEGYQIVYSDTPGMIKPKYKLHKRMMEFVDESLSEADVVVVMVVPDEKYDERELQAIARMHHAPKILVINKIDEHPAELIAAKKAEWQALLNAEHIVEMSALKNVAVDTLKQHIVELLPQHPPFYDPDTLTDRPERFFVAELIREQVFMCMSDEIPYSTEVHIVEFTEKPNIVHIEAEIYVERLTQKGMVIGKEGKMLKKIGSRARQHIEALLERQVFLQIHVKVRDGWKDNDRHLKHLGY